MEFTQLIQQPESTRGEKWEADFLTHFVSMKVEIESESAKQGPDGWPYLFVKTSPQGQEPTTEILAWLAQRGIGLVVNAHKMVPDYVFPYGMIWNFVETGRFVLPRNEMPSGDVVYSKDKNLLIGPPSEKYLPPYVRTVLKEFLASQGYLQPRVLVVSTPDFQTVDLIISVNSLGNLEPEKRKPMAELLAWFLPLHYTLVLGEEKDLPAFYDL